MFWHVAGMQCTRLGRFSRYPTGWESPLLAFSSMRWSLVRISLLLIIRLGYHQGHIGTSQGSNWDKSAHQGPTGMLWGLSLCVIRLSSWLHYHYITITDATLVDKKKLQRFVQWYCSDNHPYLAFRLSSWCTTLESRILLSLGELPPRTKLQKCVHAGLASLVESVCHLRLLLSLSLSLLL